MEKLCLIIPNRSSPNLYFQTPTLYIVYLRSLLLKELHRAKYVKIHISKDIKLSVQNDETTAYQGSHFRGMVRSPAHQEGAC